MRHTEFRQYEKPGPKQQLLILWAVYFLYQNVYTYPFTKQHNAVEHFSLTEKDSIWIRTEDA